jgi:hypothetical protein
MLEEIESIAIDYFETNGFLVRTSASLLGRQAEGFFPSLVVRNVKEAELQDMMFFSFQWFSSDIMKARRAVVSMVGEGYLSAATRSLRQDKQFAQGIKKLLSGKHAQRFPWENAELQDDFRGHHHLVLLPLFPTAEPGHSQLMELLQGRGVSGVITIRSLLDNLIQQLDTLEEARLTPRLKLLKLVKQMELLKVPQLDLL